jgi:hypothetical protein
MITKQDYINRLHNEVRILKHLAEKATTPEILNYRFSEAQRTTGQWLAYLAIIGSAAAKDVLTDDGSGFATFMERYEQFDVSTFASAIDADTAEVVRLLEATSDEKLQESKTMFGSFTASRANHMFGILDWYVAYKTQIFLQLKAAGVPNLGTSNLWGGMDTPPKAE